MAATRGSHFPDTLDGVAASADTKVVGVHLAAGVAWFASTDGDGQFIEDRSDRIELQDDELGEARALDEFEESAEALLRRIQPQALALLNAGQSQRPPAAPDSRKRGALEGALLIAAHRTSTPVVRVGHQEVENELGHRPTKPNELRQDLAAEVANGAPSNWSSRGPALAAAVVVSRR